MPLASKGPVSVQWWPQGEPHGHMLVISPGNEVVDDAWTTIEDFATELAEAVANCSQERHDGRGRQHSLEDQKNAYYTAIQQLVSRDFDAEWEDTLRRQRAYRKWGGPVPAAVLVPDPHDPKKWLGVMTDKEGEPTIYKVRPHVMDEVPTPDYQNAVRDPAGFSWLRKRRLGAEQRLQRLKKRG